MGLTRIVWDTNIFIYLLEPNGALTAKANELLKRMKHGGLELSTSIITSAELQSGPMKEGNRALAREYREFLKQMTKLLPFSEAEAERYAEIRQLAPVRGADAVQLASASVAGTELFVTNDLRLHKCRIPGIHFIVSVETALKLIQ